VITFQNGEVAQNPLSRRTTLFSFYKKGGKGGGEKKRGKRQSVGLRERKEGGKMNSIAWWGKRMMGLAGKKKEEARAALVEYGKKSCKRREKHLGTEKKVNHLFSERGEPFHREDTD